MSETIVKKGTDEFKVACQQYLKLFFESKETDYLPRGVFQFGENAGKCLGHTSKRILEANLPKPFGCPSLFIQPCIDENEKVTGIIWFCDRSGCICVCCREDFTTPQEEYPNYCPKEGEEYFGDDFDDEDEWEEDEF